MSQYCEEFGATDEDNCATTFAIADCATNPFTPTCTAVIGLHETRVQQCRDFKSEINPVALPDGASCDDTINLVCFGNADTGGDIVATPFDSLCADAAYDSARAPLCGENVKAPNLKPVT